MILTDRGASAMRSPVSWAVLGLLIERPGYGYDLVQRFERTYGDALELSTPSQIYAALKGLEQRSLIEQLPPDDASPEELRQPRPRYRATEGGLEGYQDWLIAQAHEERRRSRLFARQIVVLEPRAALTVIERYEQACLDEAKRTPLGPVEDSSSAVDGACGLAARLSGEEDRLAVGARLAWIEYARRELKALAAGRSPRR